MLKTAKATATAPPTVASIDNFILVISRSCVSRAGFQKEFPPSAAEIERSHAVHQKRIVIATTDPRERPPGVAQPFNAVV